MKKTVAVILIFILMLAMTACASADAKEVALDTVYSQLLETMPEMILIEDGDMRLNLMGIQADDCVQVITAVCADGLRTDEVWLIEAKDAAALDRIAALAENRLLAKAAESETYSPEQYAVVQKAETVTEGLYFALLVSPDVDTLKAAVEAAVK